MQKNLQRNDRSFYSKVRRIDASQSKSICKSSAKIPAIGDGVGVGSSACCNGYQLEIVVDVVVSLTESDKCPLSE